MELTQGQISEIISNYTSSSEGFVTLQSLIMNSLMAHERELFVKANKNEQCNGFRPRRWYCKGYTFVLRIPRSRSGNLAYMRKVCLKSSIPLLSIRGMELYKVLNEDLSSFRTNPLM